MGCVNVFRLTCSRGCCLNWASATPLPGAPAPERADGKSLGPRDAFKGAAQLWTAARTAAAEEEVMAEAPDSPPPPQRHVRRPPAPPPLREKLCPQGHALRHQEVTPRSEGFTCDGGCAHGHAVGDCEECPGGCGHVFVKREWIRSCSRCDYDLCAACGEPSAPRSPTPDPVRVRPRGRQ